MEVKLEDVVCESLKQILDDGILWLSLPETLKADMARVNGKHGKFLLTYSVILFLYIKICKNITIPSFRIRYSVYLEQTTHIIYIYL